jgi:ubiquinone/menaquinone biosynthesis C-methylase UbiE
MTQAASSGSADGSSAVTHEAYTQTGNERFDALLRSRTAAMSAAFFLPHLRPGMQVLDCGCGPGSITLGLAEAVAPGQVVGLELDPTQVDAARALAGDLDVGNVAFQVGSVYELPFTDAFFDAAFAHMVFIHLSAPVLALQELRRVLKRGGVIGLRDADEGATVLAPASPLLEQARDVELRILQHHGGNPFVGRQLRRLLREAGFGRSVGAATAYAGGTAETTNRYAANWRARFESVSHFRTAIEQGWATNQQLVAMAEEITAWGAHPDALFSLTVCSAVGWAE